MLNNTQCGYSKHKKLKMLHKTIDEKGADDGTVTIRQWVAVLIADLVQEHERHGLDLGRHVKHVSQSTSDGTRSALEAGSANETNVPCQQVCMT